MSAASRSESCANSDDPSAYLLRMGCDQIAKRLGVTVDALVKMASRNLAERGHPRSKKLCWVTLRSSDFSEMYLPPKGKKADVWGENPEWWQPEKPDEWKAPLPPPLKFNGVSAEGVMADIGRGARRRRQAAILDEMRDELPWWWQIDPDAPRIVYQPAGDVTRDMAEGRIMRVVSASGAQETAALHRQSFEPTAFHALSDAAQVFLRDETSKREQMQPSKWLARLHLDRPDLKDWLTVMSWFAAARP